MTLKDKELKGTGQTQLIKSFVLGRGRLTARQKKALIENGPLWLLPYKPVFIDWKAFFGLEGLKIMEIGFGMGDSLAALASAHPDRMYLGVEVYPPGLGHMLSLIEEKKIHNVRLIGHDAIEVLSYMIEAESLDGLQVYFPDPWPKKRHHKRRLVQEYFLSLAFSRLKPGAYLHLATDWQPYADSMLLLLNQHRGFLNLAGEGFSPHRGERIETKFERRGKELGRKVWDLSLIHI